MSVHYQDDWMTIHEGDNRAIMRELQPDSIHCVMTSPPYYGLRDYGIPPVVWGGDPLCAHDFGDDTIERADTWGTSKRRWQHEQDHGEDINAEREPTVTRGAYCSGCHAWRGQLGLEPTPTLYVEHLVETFREVRRVLHPEGLVWLNMGDSYAAERSGTEMPAETMAGGVGGHGDAASKRGRPKREHPEDRLARHDGLPHRNAKAIGLKHKDLMLLPSMVAKALRDPYYTGRIKRDVDRAWLAAMIDGEGCIFIGRVRAGTPTGRVKPDGTRTPRALDGFQPCIKVTNTSRAIVERCLAIVGRGTIRTVGKGNRRPAYEWAVYSDQARGVLAEVYPDLVAKQHEARLAYGVPSSAGNGEACWIGLKAIHQGQPCDMDMPAPPSMWEPGWYLRRDVIWSKPNPMPESAEDRPASSHEYVFMLSRSERYFYDRVAVLEPTVSGHSSGNGFARPERISGGLARGREDEWAESSGRNRRSVWTIPTKPYKGAHYAVFPKSLVEVPVKASTSQAGACPECGAQWVRLTTKAAGGKVRERSKAGLGTAESRETHGLEAVGGEFTEDVAVETLGWRPGCGHGWGGDPDDLDIIASPMRSGREPQPQDHLPGSGQRPSGQRGNRTSDIEATTRRGLDRERKAGEGRRLITRFEQRAYARQLKAWPPLRQQAALDEIAEWLGKDDELAEYTAAWKATGVPPAEPHPAEDAWRHYLRDDRRGARAIPPKLFDGWLALGWLTPVEPPDYSGALAPVPAVVMDIYGGSGTVGVVAQSLGRRAVLIDVNGDYLLQQMERNAQIGLGMGV